MAWQKGVKEIIKSLGVVGVVRLPGWGPRDPVCAWLETLQEIAANRFGRFHRLLRSTVSHPPVHTYRKVVVAVFPLIYLLLTRQTVMNCSDAAITGFRCNNEHFSEPEQMSEMYINQLPSKQTQHHGNINEFVEEPTKSRKVPGQRPLLGSVYIHLEGTGVGIPGFQVVRKKLTWIRKNVWEVVDVDQKEEWSQDGALRNSDGNRRWRG
ncbi:hypothetical protein T265_15028, partial [Opisthorchis viverrini]